MNRETRELHRNTHSDASPRRQSLTEQSFRRELQGIQNEYLANVTRIEHKRNTNHTTLGDTKGDIEETNKMIEEVIDNIEESIKAMKGEFSSLFYEGQITSLKDTRKKQLEFLEDRKTAIDKTLGKDAIAAQEKINELYSKNPETPTQLRTYLGELEHWFGIEASYTRSMEAVYRAFTDQDAKIIGGLNKLQESVFASLRSQ